MKSRPKGHGLDIHGWDLVRVWRHRAEIENAIMSEQMAWIVAWSVASLVVIAVVLLASE